MDYLSMAGNVANKAREVYGDYQMGKQMRLGQYKGANPSNMKQLGHYNRSGKKLAIYHG